MTKHVSIFIISRGMGKLIANIVNPILSALNPRQRKIVVERFGLSQPAYKSKTLAAIGEEFGITRERVRQIEVTALKLINQQISKNSTYLSIIKEIQSYLKSCGGVAKEENFLKFGEGIAPDWNERYAVFFSEVSGAFGFYEEDKDFWSFYFLDENSKKNAFSFLREWIKFLRKEKNKILEEGGYEREFKNFVKLKGEKLTYAHNFTQISKKITKNSFGDIGLADWPEIKPSTMRDRAYLILKKKKEPLHFRAIAAAINEVGFDNKVALAATVHNELIKDSRFVLVGRGIYGLAEHGYEPGVAKEIIHKILKKHGPLSVDEIITHIQKQRFLKPNTILANLRDKKLFEKLSDGSYRIREA